MNSLRRATRSLRQNPAFTLTAVLVLAIGIGATTAIFSVVDGTVLHSLAFPNPERLVHVSEHLGNFGEISSAYANFLDWSHQPSSFSAAFEWRPDSMTMSDGRSAERISALRATAGFFDTLAIRPSLGRPFGPNDDRRGAAACVVLTDALWSTRFGRDRGILGRSIMLEGEPFTVVGVMPESFRFPLVKVELIIPYGLTAGMNRGDHSGEAFARLKPGVPIGQANIELAAISRRLSAAYPSSNSGWNLSATPLQAYVTENSRPVMLTLLAAVGLFLLLACVNVAGLMLVRAAGRRSEFAVRIALGARFSSLLRESLCEAFLIAATGAGLGVMAAWWSIGPLVSLVPETAGISAVSIDWRVLLCAGAITTLATILVAIVPAAASFGTDPNEALRESGRANVSGMHGVRMRNALVVGELALASALAIPAGLVIKSFTQLIKVDPGFDARRTLTLNVEISGPTYSKGSQQTAFWRHVLDRASIQPSIASVGMVSFLPMSGNDTENGYWIVGRPKPGNSSEIPYADLFVIGGEYLRTMGIPLLRGRAFGPSDTAASAPVVIVDDEFVRKNFPNHDPLQYRINYNDKICQIVGVVRHVKDFGLNGASREQFYFPFEQVPFPFMTMTLRPAADAASAIRAFRDTVRGIDPGVPVFQVRRMSSWVEDSTWRSRLSAVLFAIFSGIGLVLASIGVYGVVAFSVAQQTREIGVRMALGATRAVVMRLVLKRALLLSVSGIAIGIAAALPLTGFLGTLLFQVRPTDPAVMSVAVALLIFAAALASTIPALRAANTDPLGAIRHG